MITMADNWKEDVIKNKLGGKREWTEKERMELCHDLDHDLNKQLDSLAKKDHPQKDRWTEENWREKMAEHPIFSPYLQEGSEGQTPINDLSEGLAQLKYAPEYNSPTEIAQNYKDEGVNHFKYKKYRFAIASFTEGLKAKSEDAELNAHLYNNRAAAQYYLKNYRSSLKDCMKAVELKPDYMKTIHRAIESASKLGSWGEVIEWCDKGLLIDPSLQDLIRQRTSAMTEKKRQYRDDRVLAQRTKQRLQEEAALLEEVAKRGIRVRAAASSEANPVDATPPARVSLRDLEPRHPSVTGRVHRSPEGELMWPVLFLYPEHNESDIVLDFAESARFEEHLEVMFGRDAPLPPWDPDRRYVPPHLVLFFEADPGPHLVRVVSSRSLGEVLLDPRYEVVAGTPEFLVLVEGSPFYKDFVAGYSTG